MRPQEKITVAEPLRAITIGAAYDLGKEKEIGNIEIGKRANFTVLDDNPLTTESANTRVAGSPYPQ